MKEKKEKFYQKRIQFLETENQQLKEEKALIELQLVKYKENIDYDASESKKFLESVLKLDKEYKERLSVLNSKIKECEDIIKNYHIKQKDYEKRMDDEFKIYMNAFKKVGDKNGRQ